MAENVLKTGRSLKFARQPSEYNRRIVAVFKCKQKFIFLPTSGAYTLTNVVRTKLQCDLYHFFVSFRFRDDKEDYFFVLSDLSSYLDIDIPRKLY